MPKTELSYVLGSSVKQIIVDGDSEDWGNIAPLATFQSRSINPPELEVSNIYVANDDENLYTRIDTRGIPTTSANIGILSRQLYVYFDADNNNTGFLREGGRNLMLTYFLNLNR